METIDFTVGLSYHDIQNEGFKNHIMKEENEYIEKQEILDAIRESLLEIRDAKLNGRELMSAEDLLNEL